MVGVGQVDVEKDVKQKNAKCKGIIWLALDNFVWNRIRNLPIQFSGIRVVASNKVNTSQNFQNNSTVVFCSYVSKIFWKKDLQKQQPPMILQYHPCIVYLHLVFYLMFMEQMLVHIPYLHECYGA